MDASASKDTTEENTMDEQKELEELKVKASALEEKLAKKAELSSANAEAGVKKIALEYKIVEQFIPMSLNGVRDGATNRFESRDFILAHNFNKTPEKMRAGLNLANSGAPVSLSLHFNSNPNASVAKAIQTFIESSNTLYIKPDGASSLIAN